MSNQLYDNAAESYLDDQIRPKDKSRTVRVISSGYSHTGSLSFALAIQIFLKGPMCHGGSVSLAREERKFISYSTKISPTSIHSLMPHNYQIMCSYQIMFTDFLITQCV